MAVAPNDWQLECTKLKQRGAYLLKSGQWTDCTFLVGTEPNQVVIEGHKLILAMASPVFEAMFFGGMAEGNEPIPILDVQIDAFKALLEYIYTDNINITSFDKACELCYGAKKYMLPHLVKECTRYLWSDLYPRNACRAYEFANLFEENNLMEKCIQIISTNTKEILNDSSFEEMDINTVITVFSLDHLNIDSELDLFEAIVRYAKAAERRNAERSASPTGSSSNSDRKSSMPSTSQEKEQVFNVESSAESSPAAAPEPGRADHEPPPETSRPKVSAGTSAGAGVGAGVGAETARALVRPALERVRFLTLSAQQFAAGPARSPLLTESEAFAVLMNILSTSDVPMPRGFSTCRTPRKTLVGSHFAAPDYSLSVAAVDTPSPVSLDVVWLPASERDRAEHRAELRAEHRAPQPWERAGWDSATGGRGRSRGGGCGRGGGGGARGAPQLLPARARHAHRLPQHQRAGQLRHLHGRQKHMRAGRAGADAGAERGGRRGARARRRLLRAAVRAPAGRGRRAAHVHALHVARVLPPPARHHVQPARLRAAQQGVQSGHRVQQSGVVPDGHGGAAGAGGRRALQLRHRPELRLRARRPHPLHHIHLLALPRVRARTAIGESPPPRAFPTICAVVSFSLLKCFDPVA